MYFISNDLMRFNMPIMVSRKGRALFQNWLVLYKNLKHFTCPVCFCFLISIRGGLRWVKAPLTYTTFCVMCACLGLPTCNCKIIYHHHISCKLLTVSNVLLHTRHTRLVRNYLTFTESSYYRVSHLSSSWILNDTWSESLPSSCATRRRQFC